MPLMHACRSATMLAFMYAHKQIHVYLFECTYVQICAYPEITVNESKQDANNYSLAVYPGTYNGLTS